MYLGRKSSWLKHLDFIILDLIALSISYFLAIYIRFGEVGFTDTIVRYTYVFYVLSDLLVVLFFESYKDILKRGYYAEALKAVKHSFLIMLLVAMLLFITQTGYIQSRLIVILTALLFVAFMYVFRILRKKSILKNDMNNLKMLLIITDKNNYDEIEEKVRNNKFYGYTVLDIICLNDVGRADVKVINNHEEIIEYASKRWIDECLISTDSDYMSVIDIVDAFIEMGITTQYELYKRQNIYEHTIGHIGEYTVLTRSVKIISYRDAFLKRCLDICGGLVGSLLTLILCCTVGLAIKIKDPGPMFFSQTRIGKNGKKFKIYKFRSMYMDAEERKKELMERNDYANGLMFKMEDDPRIIEGIGNFIRDYSLDEFPQFFNVLLGQMSMVGTRPPLVDEWEKYSLHHRIRMATKPGITGMWQVSGRSDITDFEEVVKLDKEYINNWNIGLDIKIILKTVMVVFKKDGAR